MKIEAEYRVDDAVEELVSEGEQGDACEESHERWSTTFLFEIQKFQLLFKLNNN